MVEEEEEEEEEGVTRLVKLSAVPLIPSQNVRYSAPPPSARSEPQQCFTKNILPLP